MSDNGDESVPPVDPVPRHVAIIMDGNGRWAKQRHLPRIAGHRAGVEAVRTVVQDGARYGIQVVTLFAFSSENWRRPPGEISLLMELFLTALQREVKGLQRNNVQLRVIGDRAPLGERLREEIATAESLTADNDGLTLVVAANYGGRWDIAQVAQQLGTEVAAGQLQINDITPELIGERVALADLPEPDLFIRTGGEQRISNFLLWQLAYTEFYFTNTLWPDFDSQAFQQALLSFGRRERRFGRTGEQMETPRGA